MATIELLSLDERAGVIARALIEQARDDLAIATAIVSAAACVVAADAFGTEVAPTEALEERLLGFRRTARLALTTIIRREGRVVMDPHTRALGLVLEAAHDRELASAIPQAAAMVVAADAWRCTAPDAALEERLGRFGDAARLALVTVRQHRARLT